MVKTRASLFKRQANLQSLLRSNGSVVWALGLLLASACALGGSARADVASLMLLRPLGIVLLGFGLARLTRDDLGAYRFPFLMAALMVAWLALQLAPLPPALWQALPGRELVAEIDRAAGLKDVWRPISLAPDATMNAFFALLAPIGVLVLGSKLDAHAHYAVLVLILLIGACSALLGLLQTLSDPYGALYPYRITNNGSAVGLFANRNHQALLLALLLPMLALAARLTSRPSLKFIAILTGLILLPLILVTGSRSGVVCALIALAAIPFILMGAQPAGEATRRPSSGGKSDLRRSHRLALIIIAAGALVALTVWQGRDAAWDRLLATTPVEELRVAIVPVLIPIIGAYSPFGSGTGSFVSVYQIHEPDQLLASFYVNHAHNDWLEVVMTDGLPGAVFLLVAALAFLAAAYRAFRPGQAFTAQTGFARLGLVIVMLSAVASLTDYPLRTPALACLFALAVLWVAQSRSRSTATNQ